MNNSREIAKQKNQTKEIAYRMTWTELRKGNFMKETECLLIKAHNKPMETNYIKEKLDNTQQNIKQ